MPGGGLPPHLQQGGGAPGLPPHLQQGGGGAAGAGGGGNPSETLTAATASVPGGERIIHCCLK